MFECVLLRKDSEYIVKPFFERKQKRYIVRYTVKILADYTQVHLKRVMLHSATHGIRQCIQLQFS